MSITFFRLTEQGAVLFVRASPGASKDQIAGLKTGAAGEQRLVVKVTAPPDKGKANAAIIALIAKSLNLPKSSVSVLNGETSRLKTIEVACRVPDLTHRLAKLWEGS